MLHHISLGNWTDGFTGPVMTGLGPSLRRMPSGDPKGPSQTSGVDGRPDGGSDAGDSADSLLTGQPFHPAQSHST